MDVMVITAMETTLALNACMCTNKTKGPAMVLACPVTADRRIAETLVGVVED